MKPLFVFSVIACCWLSCKVNYYTTNHAFVFQDSLSLSRDYQLYVRKLVYDMTTDQIKLSNDRQPDTTTVKMIELDYLLYNKQTHQAIHFPYVPSYYYEYNKKDKGGLYTKIYNDSTLYLHQIRRINFLIGEGNDHLRMNDFTYTYKELENGDLLFYEARSNTNHYLTGTIHLDETLGCPMQFEPRRRFDIQQFIPDTLAQSLFQKIRNVKIKEQLRAVPTNHVLYVLNNGTRKGLVFHLDGSNKAIFRKKSTNYFSLFKKH